MMFGMVICSLFLVCVCVRACVPVCAGLYLSVELLKVWSGNIARRCCDSVGARGEEQLSCDALCLECLQFLQFGKPPLQEYVDSLSEDAERMLSCVQQIRRERWRPNACATRLACRCYCYPTKTAHARLPWQSFHVVLPGTPEELGSQLQHTARSTVARMPTGLAFSPLLLKTVLARSPHMQRPRCSHGARGLRLGVTETSN